MFIVFLFNFFFAIVLTLFLCRYSTKVFPSHRCSHENPTPTSGGLAFIIPFLITLCTIHYFYTPLPAFQAYFFGVLFLSGVSFWDDVKPLSYRLRLCVQAISALLLIISGLFIETPLISVSTSSLVFLKQFLTFVVFLCIINGTNFIDGLNGLLGLNVLTTLIFYCLWCQNSPPLCLLSLSLVAGIMAFLCYNFPKGRIFMGDTGSVFLGYTLVYLALLAQPVFDQLANTQTAIFNKGFVFTLMPMSFLWFDVAFTLGRRAVQGFHLTQAHRHHMFHILFDKGYSHTFVTLTNTALTMSMGVALYFCYHGILPFIVLLCGYGVCQYLFVQYIFKCCQSKYAVDR